MRLHHLRSSTRAYRGRGNSVRAIASARRARAAAAPFHRSSVYQTRKGRRDYEGRNEPDGARLASAGGAALEIECVASTGAKSSLHAIAQPLVATFERAHETLIKMLRTRESDRRQKRRSAPKAIPMKR